MPQRCLLVQGDPAQLVWGSGTTGMGDEHCGGECEKLLQYPSDRAEPERNASSASSNPQREKEIVWCSKEELEAWALKVNSPLFSQPYLKKRIFMEGEKEAAFSPQGRLYRCYHIPPRCLLESR